MERIHSLARIACADRGFLPGGTAHVPDPHPAYPSGATAPGRVAMVTNESGSCGHGGGAAGPVVCGRAIVQYN